MKWRNPIPEGARPDLAATTILLAVSLAVRLRHLPRPLHGDEMISFSNMVLGRDFGGILFGPFDSNSHLLNSLIIKAVHFGAGENPALMRLPNLVFTLLAIALVYVVCSREFGRAPAFAAALLVSLHPAMVLFSVSIRGYAGMVLFTLVSSILFFQLLRSFSWRRWFGCVAAGFLAGASHLFAVNALIAQSLLAVGIAAHPDHDRGTGLAARARRTAPVILAPLGALTLLAALVIPQLRQTHTESFRYPFQTDFPIALINFLGGTGYRTDLDVFSLVLVALAVAGFIGAKIDGAWKTYSVLLFLSPISLYGLSYFAPVYTLHPRFFVFLLPFFCMLVIAGIEFAAASVGSMASESRRGRSAFRFGVWLCVGLVALVFVDRIRVPGGSAFAHAQTLVGEFVTTHPEARFLTNDPGFVRVRLRQEANMDRIHPALGIKPIRAYQAQAPTNEIYFIYIPKKRLTEADLVHYQGEVPPEVLYERDDRMRMYLTRNATLELDAGPRAQIYAFGPRPVKGIETGRVN